MICLLLLVSAPPSLSLGPEQGQRPGAQHLSRGAPTEHKGEEGMVAEQQHDTEHGPEAAPRRALLQLQQPIVLGDRRTG